MFRHLYNIFDIYSYIQTHAYTKYCIFLITLGVLFSLCFLLGFNMNFKVYASVLII